MSYILFICFQVRLILLMGLVILPGNLVIQISTGNVMVTFSFPEQPVVSLIYCNGVCTGRIRKAKKKKATVSQLQNTVSTLRIIQMSFKCVRGLTISKIGNNHLVYHETKSGRFFFVFF